MSDSQAAEEAVVLRYTAKDDAYFMGVPARDLTDDDVALVVLSGQFGKTKPTVIKRLAESAMYAEPSKPKTTEAASEPAVPDKADKEAS